MASRSRSVLGERGRRAAVLAGPSARVWTWQPLGCAIVTTMALVAFGSRAGVALRLSIAGAVVAAASGFLLDDPAAVTLAASPLSLRRRRLQRVTAVALAVGAWWAAAATIASRLGGGFPLRGRALELSVFVAVALAGSATASNLGDGTVGGIAGAVSAAGCYAITFLPPRVWLPLPSSPNAPGAASRLLVVLAVAIAVLGWASRDPAHRRRHHRSSGSRGT